MNNLKRKVMASAAMLLVAAIMMTSSSFAWYTLSKQGEAKQIKVNLSATDNLEISKADKGDWAEYGSKSQLSVQAGDSEDEYKWGARVTSWDYSKATASVPATLSENWIKSMNYDADGRADELVDAYHDGLDKGQEKFFVDIDNGATTKYKDCAVGYAVWLRSNNDLDDVTATFNGVSAANLDKVDIGLIVKEKNNANNALQAAEVRTDADGHNVISLTANEPKLVEVVVFFNGDVIEADDILNDLSEDNITVTFSSEKLKAEANKNESQYNVNY